MNQSPATRVHFALSMLCLLILVGCDTGSQATAPEKGEIEAYLADNPDVASEDAPAMEVGDE